MGDRKSNRVLLVVLAALVITGGFYYFFWPDLAKYLQMGRQKLFLQERVAEEESKGQRLKKEQEALAQDPVQIEKVAREKLGLSRPHELIYKFEEGSKQEPAVPAKQGKVKE